MRTQSECSVETCDRPARNLNGWCWAHYYRWRRNGDVRADVPLQRRNQQCSVDRCERPATGRGLCDTHYCRWKRTREIGAADIAAYGGPRLSREGLTYQAAHQRVKRVRGKASEYPCFECGGVALDWAYQHNDPCPLYYNGQLTHPFSDDISRYEPMCRPCHNRLDHRKIVKPNGAE